MVFEPTTVRVRTSQTARASGTTYSTHSPGTPKATGVMHMISPNTPIRAVSGSRKVTVAESVTTP